MKIQLPSEVTGAKIFSALGDVARNKMYSITYMGRDRIIQGGETELDWANVFLSKQNGPRFEFYEKSGGGWPYPSNLALLADRKYSSICIDYRFRDSIFGRREKTEKELKGLIEEFYRCIVV